MSEFEIKLRLSEMDDEGFLIQNYSKSDFGRINRSRGFFHSVYT